MDQFERVNVLRLYSKFKKEFKICVAGSSMNPILYDGDIITVCRKDKYQNGDIIVYIYKNSEILVHRLLKVQNNRYCCKGDNSFRIEDIDYDQILGVVLIDDDKNNNIDFINFSLKIGNLFRKCKYKTDLLVLTEEYKNYSILYLNSSEDN